jgi:hypothetical protein
MEKSHSWEAKSVSQSVEKLPTSYGTRRVITVFTRARHWSLFWIQSTSSHPITLSYILISTSDLRLGLSSGNFPSVFQPTYCMDFSSIPCLLRAPPIILPWFDHPNNIWWTVSSSLCSLLQPPVTSSLLGPNIHLSTLSQCSHIVLRSRRRKSPKMATVRRHI